MDMALAEYERLVDVAPIVLMDEPDWEDRLTRELGKPIELSDSDRGNRWAAAYRLYEQAIVDVIAEALAAGVSQETLRDYRGMLSRNDVAGYISRARRPFVNEGHETRWPQYGALRATEADIAKLAKSDPAAAARLHRSAKTFFRRWVREIPDRPSEAQLNGIATMWRQEYMDAWSAARKRMVERVETLALPEQ